METANQTTLFPHENGKADHALFIETANRTTASPQEASRWTTASPQQSSKTRPQHLPMKTANRTTATRDGKSKPDYSNSHGNSKPNHKWTQQSG